MSRLKVGDVITKFNWGESYLVIGCLGNNEYLLRGLRGTTEVEWVYPDNLEGLIVNEDLQAVNKTAIERKIAFMYKRFEER